ncbi:MAG: four helix bundle protein [Melioribacteraceae bacterium]|nr:MAG: four helix bundle protein [Melioribacteraceae bacterium]
MKATRFEDLEIWQESRMIIKSIYNLTSKDKFAKDFGLRDQIQRASVSIMNNIAEGFERDNNKEFLRFLSYAKGSAGELRSLLYVALDLEYINKNEFETIYESSSIIIKKISSLIKYLKTKT